MRFGGMTPYPRKCGGGTPRVQDIFESLAADLGTAYDAFNSSKAVYVQTLAMARALSAVWGTNERIAKVWQPMRCSLAILSRWERILYLPPNPKDAVYDRRVRVTNHIAQFGEAVTGDYLTAILTREVPSAFVAVEYLDVTKARVLVPSGSYPFGIVGSGPGAFPWASTVCHVMVRLTSPTGWTEVDFYKAAARCAEVLDPILPAWVTFDWYRPGPISSAVTGGPSAGGFYLDDAHNLDNEVFD